MSKRIFELILHCATGEHRIRFDFDLSLYSHHVLHDFLERDLLPEPGSSAVLCRLLRPGDQFIDVGAHIGYFSLLASTLVGPGGTVYSLEPEHDNFTRLLHHIALNHFDNIIPLNCAAAIQTGPRDLYIETGNDGGHAIWDLRALPDYQTPKGRLIPIPKTKIYAFALDDLFPHPTPNTIRALKIDVEGAEMEVLRGAQRLLNDAQIPLVICECHHDRLMFAGTSEQMIREFMTNMGYDTYADDHKSEALIRLARNQTLNTKFVFNLVFAKPHLRPLLTPTTAHPSRALKPAATAP